MLNQIVKLRPGNGGSFNYNFVLVTFLNEAMHRCDNFLKLAKLGTIMRR